MTNYKPNSPQQTDTESPLEAMSDDQMKRFVKGLEKYIGPPKNPPMAPPSPEEPLDLQNLQFDPALAFREESEAAEAARAKKESGNGEE